MTRRAGRGGWRLGLLPGQPGVFTLSGLLDGDVLRGEGTRADGAAFRWTAKKVGEAPAAPPQAGAAEEKDDEGDNPNGRPARRGRGGGGARGDEDEGDDKP